MKETMCYLYNDKSTDSDDTPVPVNTGERVRAPG